MNATAPQPAHPIPPTQYAAPPPHWTGPVAADPRRKSPLLASLLSAMPGLGQVYVGYYKQGFIHVIVVASVIMLLSTVGSSSPLIPSLGFFLPFFWLYNIVDAGRRASFYNQALAGVEGVQIPQEMSLPSPGGSIAGGVALIAIGLVLLSNTRFGYTLEWLEEWWPVTPVIFGVWLIWRGLTDRKR